MVVTSGGYYNNAQFVSTELLYSGDQLWVYGPELPNPITYGSMVTDPSTGSVILFGGRDGQTGALQNQILRLSYPVTPTSQWEVIPQTLTVPRYGQVKISTVGIRPINNAQISNSGGRASEPNSSRFSPEGLEVRIPAQGDLKPIFFFLNVGPL